MLSLFDVVVWVVSGWAIWTHVKLVAARRFQLRLADRIFAAHEVLVVSPNGKME